MCEGRRRSCRSQQLIQTVLVLQKLIFLHIIVSAVEINGYKRQLADKVIYTSVEAPPTFHDGAHYIA